MASDPIFADTAPASNVARRLAREDLLPLERYAVERDAFRARAIAHRRARRLALGPDMSLQFEDRLTIQYQVQEMLRIERIFEPAAIQAELDAYNPLIPDGRNLKATLMLEFPDPAVRAAALRRLRGIEHKLGAQVDGLPPVHALADEDLPRSSGGKTSAVHFLRFEFAPAHVEALRAGAALAFSIDDPRHPQRVVAPAPLRDQLLRDLA
jgi:hypothetical protein